MPIFITLKRERKAFDYSGGKSKEVFIPPGTHEAERRGERLVLKGTDIGIDEKYLSFWDKPECGEWQVTIKTVGEEAPKEVVPEQKKASPEPSKETPEATQTVSAGEPQKKVSP